MPRNYDKLKISKALDVKNIRINYKNKNVGKKNNVYIDCHLIHDGKEYGMMNWVSKDEIRPSSSVREEREYDPVITLRESNKLGKAIIHISRIIQKQLLSDLENKDSEIKKIMKIAKLKTNIKNLKLSNKIQEFYDDEEGERVQMKDPIVRIAMKRNNSTGNFQFGVYKLIKNKKDPKKQFEPKEIINKNLHANAHKYFTKNTHMLVGNLKMTLVVYSKGISIKPEFKELVIHVDKASDNAPNVDLEKMGLEMDDIKDIIGDIESDSDDNTNDNNDDDDEDDEDDDEDDDDDDEDDDASNLANLLEKVSKQ